MEALYFVIACMAIDPWVDRGHVPLLFEVEGTPCVLSPPYILGVDIVC